VSALDQVGGEMTPDRAAARDDDPHQ
jgi:hypothetical protein